MHQSFSGIEVEELIRLSFCHKGHICEATFQLREFVCKAEREKLRQFDSIQRYTENPMQPFLLFHSQSSEQKFFMPNK